MDLQMNRSGRKGQRALDSRRNPNGAQIQPVTVTQAVFFSATGWAPTG
jgi:hypothetical protein